MPCPIVHNPCGKGRHWAVFRLQPGAVSGIVKGMKSWFGLGVAVSVAAVLASCATFRPETDQDKDFQAFYGKLRHEVSAQGLNPETLDAAFPDGIHPVKEVLKREGAQPEIVRTFADYVAPMLSDTRIANGRGHMVAHADALQRIQAETGVSASVVVALWGIETNFGKNTGDHPVIPALATLAWQSASRPDFYKKELFAALKISETLGRDPTTLKGSWAGAMGQCQFMPTSYLAYARDGDGDGVADIWTNENDVFASAANYLAKRKWQPGQAWKLPVTDKLDLAGVEVNSRGLSVPLSLRQWRKRGFKGAAPGFANGTELRSYKPEADGPTMLLGPNFSVILGWNNSSYFAYSVLSLSDRLADAALNTPTDSPTP